ncbi:VOC family protein [Dactylosporangium sp. CA-233914]|uniref:VOC family protein n=1 Tax=Dactylosporangium sp. CA-233914 TaxID=3239934 RepID=UPI003D8EC898
MIGKLDMVVLDAADVTGLAAFYRALAGWPELDTDDDGWITLGTPDGWKVGFQPAPDHRAPAWPGQERPQQAHLDLRVPDLEACTEQAVALGARVLRRNEAWHTLADPAGHPFDLCLSPDVPAVTLDCPDAESLAAFYTAMIGADGARPLLFQQVADYNPPRWPDPDRPQQLHLDIEVADLDAGEAATLALGATRLPGEGRSFRVFADPAGKPFCLVAEPGSPQ